MNRQVDLETYAQICWRLVTVASSPSEISRVLASYGLDPTTWEQEAGAWRQVIRSDAAKRSEFQRLYAAASANGPISSSGSTQPPSATVGNIHRSSWIWLILGTTLLAFSTFQTVIPIAAWLGPVFLMRFARTQRTRVGLPLLAVAGYVATLFATRGFLPLPAGLLIALPGIAVVLPYGLDRWLSSQANRFLRTLVFPCAATALDFLSSFGGFGTMGMTAYSQAGNLPLIALTSVTGIWGLQFLIAWAAPVVNDVWEHGFDLAAARRTVGALSVILLAVLVGGGAAVALFPASSPTVQVAGLAPSRAMVEATEQLDLGRANLSAQEKQLLHSNSIGPQIEDLLNRTAEAAAAGARIVVWSEAAVVIYKNHEAEFLNDVRQAATEHGIYLQVTPVLMLDSETHPNIEIRALMFDPAGRMIWDYTKSTAPLGDGNLPGPGIVPVADTPYGRLATVICYDADFPNLVRQAGRAGADILLVPASDFGTVGELHARMSILRAVENGMALVRPTRRGVSVAVDHRGKLLGYQDDYDAGGPQTLVVRVPTRGMRTLYAATGNWFAWASLIDLGALAAITKKRRPGTAMTT